MTLLNKDSRAASDRARAEAAREGVDQAKDDAVAAKTGAETARNESQAARSDSENARDEAITAKTQAETARDTTFGYRNTSLEIRNQTQTIRDATKADADQKLALIQQAIAENLALIGVNPDYISFTVGVKPDSTGAVDGEIGAYYTNDFLVQKIEWNSGTSEWVDVGEPVITKEYYDKGFKREWVPEKYSGNPVVRPANNIFYPPGAMYYEGYYYLAAKSQGVVALYFSKNGITNWTYSGTIAEKDSLEWGGTISKFEGTRLRYNPDRDEFWLINGVRHVGAGTDFHQSISLAIAKHPTGPYMDIGKPFIDAFDNASGYNHLEGPDVVRQENFYYWFMKAQTALDGLNCAISIFRSPVDDPFNVTFLKHAFTRAEVAAKIPRTVETLQGPCVFYYDGLYYMIITAGLYTALYGERNLWIGSSESLLGFDADSFEGVEEPFLDVGTGAGNWESRRVYFCDVLKHSDGYWLDPITTNDRLWVYYSGHNTGTIAEAPAGLAWYKLNTNLPLTDLARTEYRRTQNSIFRNRPIKHDSTAKGDYTLIRGVTTLFPITTQKVFSLGYLPLMREMVFIGEDGMIQTRNPVNTEFTGFPARQRRDFATKFTQKAFGFAYVNRKGANGKKFAVIDGTLPTADLTGTGSNLVFFNETLSYRSTLNLASTDGMSSMCFHPHNEFIYIATRNGNVIVVNTVTETVETTIEVAAGKVLGDIIYDPISRRIIVVNVTDKSVHTIDFFNVVESTWALPDMPSVKGIVTSPQAGYVYVYANVAGGSENVCAKINPFSGAITYIPVTLAIGQGTEGAFKVLLNPSKNVVYLFDRHFNNGKAHYLGSDIFGGINSPGFAKPIDAVYCPITEEVWVANETNTTTICMT